jgi:hypothetical protein
VDGFYKIDTGKCIQATILDTHETVIFHTIQFSKNMTRLMKLGQSFKANAGVVL